MAEAAGTELVADRAAEKLLGRIFWALVGLLALAGGGVTGGAFWLGQFTADMRTLQEDVSEINADLSSVVAQFEPRLRSVELRISKDILPLAEERFSDIEKRIREVERAR